MTENNTLGVHSLGRSPPAFDLAPRTNRRWRLLSTRRGSGGESTGRTIVRAARLEQTVNQRTSLPCLGVGRRKLVPAKAPKQLQRKEETDRKQEHEHMKGHNDPRWLKWGGELLSRRKDTECFPGCQAIRRDVRIVHHRQPLYRLAEMSAQGATPSASRRRKKVAVRSGPSDQRLAKRAVRLLLQPPADLTSTELESLHLLRQMHPRLEVVYELTQGFMSMLKQQQAEFLDTWLAAVQRCGMAELERFGRGIEQDKAAVLAALTLPYSNGVVEGHANRLKLIKRMMYGRAAFPLLRQRVLHCAYETKKGIISGLLQVDAQAKSQVRNWPPPRNEERCGLQAKQPASQGCSLQGGVCLQQF